MSALRDINLPKRIKILTIISEIDKALEFEWTARALKEEFELYYAIINPTANPPRMQNFLTQNGVPCYILEYKKWCEIPRIMLNLLSLIRNIRPNIVHTHLYKANLLGLVAAKLAGVKRRIYTRHHSSYNHIYHPSKVFYDKIANSIATDIVAVSDIVRKILIEWENVPPHKIHYVPHGLPFDEFAQVSQAEIKELAHKYSVTGKWPVIGVISRFTEWKGVHYIIPAFSKLLMHYPDAYLILANAVGDYEKQLNQLLTQLPRSSYRTIRFEPNVAALYKLFTLFVHVPIDEHSEAFGQVYVEAMAAGVPLICTLSGVAHELVRHERNAIVVPYQDSEAILNAMLTLLRSPDLRKRLTEQAKEDVKSFSLDRKIDLLRQVYLKSMRVA